MLPHFAVDLTRSPRTISIFRAASRQFLLLCLLSSTSAFAQYRFDHWTTDNGLPQNSVRDILQTRDGYLWLTTFDGLVRFDGVRFTVFNKTNSPGIASNRFVNLFEDRFGDLWATLETGGVVRRRQGRFMTMTQAQGVPVVNSPFLDVDDDGQGNAVVYYLQLDLDQQGKVFTRFALRAYRWSESRFQPAEELNITLSAPPLLVEDAFRWKFVNLADGDYWTFTNQRVIHLRKGGGVQVYSERNGLPGTQPGLIWGKQSPLLAVTRDASDHLWLTDLKSMHSQLLSQQTPDGFVTYAGYADREGNYWFSTYNNGLFRARPRAVTPYGKAQGLNFSEIYPLHESRDGSLWIGAYGEGVFNLKDGSFKQYPALKTKGLDSFSGLVNSLYEDRAGELWVNGVWRLVDGRYLREFWTKALLYPRNVTVWTMCEDRAGAYWLGADLGVFRYQNGTLTQFTSKDGLAGDDTKVIIEDGTGGLWLGSYGGLTHYKDGKFTVWTEKDGLPGNTVRALKQDGDGALWIGTYDSGLGRFKDGRFTRYTTKDGLFDNGVFQILEDDYGWFWLSCNRGIYRVRKQELNDFAEGRIKVITCPAYNKSDGMPSAECNGGRWPAGVKTRDGKLWFPTMGGVAMIDPSSVKANLQPPLVLIEEMQIDNEPAPLDAWESALRNPQSSIRIEPGQDNFEIAYTALSFINAENMRFKYKLEGRDTNWVDAGTRRVAYFSYLSPGNYTFRVIAANSDGIWNTTGAGVRITVVPPFWRTWWFLTLSLAAMAGAVLMWHRRRIVQLEQAGAVQSAFSRQLMQSQEGERKRIAAELHDSLGQSLAIIKNRALLSLGTPDDHDRALEQLREISEASAEAIDEVKEIAHNLRPYQLDRLGLAKTIEGMIRKVAETHDLRFTVEIDRIDGLFTPEGEINLFRIVQESVNNIVKHAAAIEASVTIKRNEHHVLVTIRDNGRGFDAAALSAAGSTPGGFGLVGMAERAHVLGGHYEIHSVPGHGTVVTLNIGLKDGEQ